VIIFQAYKAATHIRHQIMIKIATLVMGLRRMRNNGLYGGR
jgi:hypothetical protein